MKILRWFGKRNINKGGDKFLVGLVVRKKKKSHEDNLPQKLIHKQNLLMIL